MTNKQTISEMINNGSYQRQFSSSASFFPSPDFYNNSLTMWYVELYSIIYTLY